MAQNNRSKYRQRLDHLFSVMPQSNTTDPGSELELLSNWAKYLCVLTSGYLEQSIKEIVLDYASIKSQQEVIRYIDKSWPNSRNMRWDVIVSTLDKLDSTWSKEMNEWFEDENARKSHVNSIVIWRNDIAHGKDANTSGVTISSVKDRYKTIKDVVSKVETIIGTGQ